MGLNKRRAGLWPTGIIPPLYQTGEIAGLPSEVTTRQYEWNVFQSHWGQKLSLLVYEMLYSICSVGSRTMAI